MLNQFRLLSVALPTLLLTACGGGGASDNNSGNNSGAETPASFTLAISDAPVDELSAVVVCFNQIQLKRDETNGGDVTFTVGADDNTMAANDLCLDNNDNVIPNTVGLNLMDYMGSNSVNLVDGVDIDAGTYSQLRLAIADGSYAIDKVSGDKVAVSVPSNELKLDGFTAAIGGMLDFTLEFDLRKAMTNPMGQSGYFLKPRGVRLVDNSAAGHISGTVSETLLLNNNCTVAPADTSESVASVYLYQGSDLDITTLADNGGSEGVEPLASTSVTFDGVQSYNFAIGFVAAADYTIALSCDTEDDPESDDDVTMLATQNVSVTAGNMATQVTFDAP